MIRNYILICWRSILKNPLFSFINIFGLALSMSICMMVLLRILDNFNYDSFHPAPGKTFRILSGVTMNNGNKVNLATTPLPLMDALSSDTSFIEQAINIYPSLKDNAIAGTIEFDLHGAFTQPAFFKLFGFTLKHGDASTALQEPNSIVLSDATSLKFFGEINPVGKMLSFKKLGTFQVTGVMDIPPAKSHIQYDAFASASSIPTLEKEGRLPVRLDKWDTFEEAYTYALLKDDVHETTLTGKLQNVASMLNKESIDVTISFNAQPILSITPGWIELYHETSRGSSWGKLLAEIGIALIILISACFNYTNLTIAKSLTRGKEVGIRKLSGAARWQVFAQYVVEAVIISLFALCLAQVFLAFILEYKPFNDGYEMVPDIGLSLKVLLVFMLFALFAGVMAGAMPAWILSSFKPLKVLRSIGTENVLGNLSWRKVLMVFQFSLSLIIMIFLQTFYRQFTYMESAERGFEQKNILVVPFTGKADIIKAEFDQISGVEDIGLISDHFGKNVSGNVVLHDNADLKNRHQMKYYFADPELFKIMKLSLIAGENFSPSEERERFIIVNEKGAKYLGFEKTVDAVGERFYLADSTEVVIRAVIKDFYHRSVGSNIEPLVFRNVTAGFRQLLVKVDPSAQKDIHTRLETAWKKVYPDQSFTHFWLDQRIAEMNYPTADISLLGFLAFMTVSIASLGLLGMVVYTVETRRKEISIRKIVGASVPRIMMLLSNGYVILLVISGVIAIPVGYILSELFLMNFANKISLDPISLVSSFVLLLVIGLTTILSQTFKASTENPARNLRSE